MVDYRKVYNKIFTEHNYRTLLQCKEETLRSWFDGKSGTVLDLGCGAGGYSRTIRRMGFDVLGVEVSDHCCRKYLKDINHVNTDILSFLQGNNKKFDWVLFTDVIEHLDISYLDQCLPLMAKVAKSSLIGVANHSDVLSGVELHLIQKGRGWWQEKLQEYFKDVKLIEDTCQRDCLFFFECTGIQVTE